jgi:hypothetical protein
MRLILCFAVAMTVAGPAAAWAQESGAFLVRLGSDTLWLEKVTRTAGQLRGEYVIRTPRTSHRVYTADLNADGTMRRFEMVIHNLGAGPGPAETRATIEFTGDSAFTTAPRGDSTVTTRMAAGKGAVPWVQGAIGIAEQLGRQARTAGAASYTVDYVAPGAARASRVTVSRAGGDTLALMIETATARVGPWILRLDQAGRLVAYSGRGSPFQGEMERLASVDLAAASKAFADRPLGQLSARDTARARIGGAELWVDYSRPSKRGREIFGVVVPWNTVWRTGANAATQFRTPIDLVVGGAPVPAGTYTLWTLPAPGGWKLIINKQTGQWGTEYHPEQDLARVDLRAEALPQTVEQFTIAVEPQGAGALLQMSWDRTRLSVPLSRKE